MGSLYKYLVRNGDIEGGSTTTQIYDDEDEKRTSSSHSMLQ